MSFPSLLDPTKIITHKNWGVTMVVDQGRMTWHARLVFECVKDSDFFYRIAHLTANNLSLDNFQRAGCISCKSKIGVVHLDDKKERKDFKARFSEKTSTWVVERGAIKKLIREIKNENGKEYPFNFCGSFSMFAKKIEVFKICHPLLAEIRKRDVKLFLCLYDSSINELETGMEAEKFASSIKKVLAQVREAALTAILNENDKLNKEYSFFELLELVESVDKECFYDDLLELIKIYVIKLTESQQNCFTWSKLKLGRIGIVLPQGKLASVISITSTCLVPKIKIPRLEGVEGKVFERIVNYDRRDARPEVVKSVEAKAKHNLVFGIASLISKLIAGCAPAVAFTTGICLYDKYEAPRRMGVIVLISVIGSVSLVAFEYISQKSFSLGKRRQIDLLEATNPKVMNLIEKNPKNLAHWDKSSWFNAVSKNI